MAKGHDTKIMAMADGVEIDSFRALLSVNVDWGLVTETYEYVGADAAEIDESNDPATLQFNFHPKSTDYARFIDLRRRRALPTDDPDYIDVTFDATMRVNHGDRGLERWAFPDLKIGTATTAVEGRKARVNGNVTAMCVKPKLTV